MFEVETTVDNAVVPITEVAAAVEIPLTEAVPIRLPDAVKSGVPAPGVVAKLKSGVKPLPAIV